MDLERRNGTLTATHALNGKLSAQTGRSMHPQTKARQEPYVWVSWVTKLLAGESSCVWSAWLRAHFQTAKAPTTFDMGAWQVEHSAVLRKAVMDYEKEGYAAYVEDQNSFVLKGKSGSLSGKPDLVAVKDGAGWVVDTKTGLPKASDRIQVMIYMWALPLTNPAFADVAFEGKVIYRTGYNLIRPEEIDEKFVKAVGELMRMVCGEEEPHKAPSFAECQNCPITPEDCGDRAEAAKFHQGETVEF